MERVLQRIVRKKDLPQYVGLKRTAIDDLIKAGTFPKPIKLSERARGWTQESLISWQQQRIAASE
jgi:prophage regulatory protein